MDETLAELYSVYYFIASLRLQETLRESKYNDTLPKSLEIQLQHAYDLFVNYILTEEESDHPLGILRPGILDVMFELYALKNKDIIKDVIIYSNNGHLESLEFIRDVIHKYINANDLIKDCIHWHHPLRREETVLRQGVSNKTWSVLKNIMITGKCQVPRSLQPEDVHFFDDLEHLDLKVELRKNYHKVPPYTFRASFGRLSDIYRLAIQNANVNTTLLLEYIIPLFTNQKDTISYDNELDCIIEIFEKKTGHTENSITIPPYADPGVNIMLDVINDIRSKIDYFHGGRLRGNRSNQFTRRNVRTRRGGKHHRGRSSHTNRKRKRTN